jgi:hypothetical protein
MTFGQTHVPAALLPMEIPVSTEYKAKWVSDKDEIFGENNYLAPVGNRNTIIQTSSPYPNHYTNRTNQAHLHY